MLGQVPEMLAHLLGPSGAVEPDHVGAQGIEGGKGAPDLGAEQHPPGQLDRHLHLDRHRPACVGHGPATADDGGLGLEQILDRLDDQEVDATVEQAPGRLLVAVALVGEGDLAERGDLGAGAERAGHPAVAGHVPGDAGRLQGQLTGPRRDAVFGQHPRQGAEAVGLDHVDPDVEERPVQVGHHVGPGVAQELVAPLHGRSAEVIRAQMAQLEVGPGGAVEDDHALAHGVEKGVHDEPGYLGK